MNGGVGNGTGLYDNQGKLIRTQGALFNSLLHFIGFGQEAVLNTEIVQRLGTFFPHADGTSSTNRPAFQTNDPYAYGIAAFSQDRT
ncbi:MAG: hypothetical protein ACKO7W_14295 [Elainella sp.]